MPAAPDGELILAGTGGHCCAGSERGVFSARPTAGDCGSGSGTGNVVVVAHACSICAPDVWPECDSDRALGGLVIYGPESDVVLVDLTVPTVSTNHTASMAMTSSRGQGSRAEGTVFWNTAGQRVREQHMVQVPDQPVALLSPLWQRAGRVLGASGSYADTCLLG